jgi:hypothetical protein
MTDHHLRLAKTLSWYAHHDASSAGLRSALLAGAEALEEAAKRDTLDDEAELLIAESYR